MSEQKIRFTFSAGYFTFGPYETFRAATIAAADYAERRFSADTSLIPSWPRVTIDEVREILNALDSDK